MQAIWNGKILADSNDTVVIEGNSYFPPETVRFEYLKKNNWRTICYWKGIARYYDGIDGDKRRRNIGWFYPNPTWPSRKIAGRDFSNYIAFGSDVHIS